MVQEFDSIDVRPYQIMCIICRLGSDDPAAYCFGERLDEISAAARADLIKPLTLRCNVDSVYAYQNPGRECDTPEGGLFNDKRDLDILQRLGMVPGATRPALEVFHHVFQDIPDCRGICGPGRTPSETWQGCRLADSGNYERGIAQGVGAVIPPRCEDEKARDKRDSCAAMGEAQVLQIRPHHLMCMTCFHGGRESPEPKEEDNVFEAIDIIQHNPDIPVELISGPCMICLPCGKYRPESGLCVSGNGMGLRDQKKDLDVLKILGLKYGDVLPARTLLQRLYDSIHSTLQVCGYEDGICRAPQWRVCGGGPEGNAGYTRARAAGLGVPGVSCDTTPEQQE